MLRGMVIGGHGAGSEYNRGFKQIDNLPYCNEGDNNWFIQQEIIDYANKNYDMKFDTIRKNRADDPTLQQRGNAGDGYDIHLNIHSNAVNGNVRGVEIFPDTYEPNINLANAMAKSLSDGLGIPNRGVIYRDYDTEAFNRTPTWHVPCWYAENRYSDADNILLIEIAYHDNINDARILRTKHKEIAKIIVDTIAKHFSYSKKGTTDNNNNDNNNNDNVGNVGGDNSSTTNPDVKLTPEQAIAKIAPLAQKYYVKGSSALPSVLIAQVMLETGFLSSELFNKANNPAGIKYSAPYSDSFGYYEKVSPEWVNGKTVPMSSKFVKFPSMESGIEYMSKHMVSTPARKDIYAKVLGSNDYKVQANGLSSTWASDPSYGTKLIELIDKYGLTKYDKAEQPTTPDPKPSEGQNPNTPTPSNPPTPEKSPIDLLEPYIGKDGSFFNKWFYGYDNDDEHCAMTVSWAYTQAGVPLKEGWVDNVKDFFIEKKAWHTRANGYKPKKNDAIIFDYEPNGFGNHVGLVRYSDNSYVYTREGNTGTDGINRDRTYSLSDWRIMGYGEWEKVKPRSNTPVTPVENDPIVAREVDVPNGIKGYVSVDAAKADKLGKALEPGKYFIYKQYEEYMNVTKQNGVPGYWVLLSQSPVKLMRVYEITETQVGAYKVKENAEAKLKELETSGKKGIIRED